MLSFDDETKFLAWAVAGALNRFYSTGRTGLTKSRRDPRSSSLLDSSSSELQEPSLSSYLERRLMLQVQQSSHFPKENFTRQTSQRGLFESGKFGYFKGKLGFLSIPVLRLVSLSADESVPPSSIWTLLGAEALLPSWFLTCRIAVSYDEPFFGFPCMIPTVSLKIRCQSLWMSPGLETRISLPFI